MNEIVNKVAASGIVTLDLQICKPISSDMAALDMKDFLVQEFLFKEAHFRELVKTLDTQVFAGKHVALYCSNDAIVPYWAFLLLASTIGPLAKAVTFATPADAAIQLWTERVLSMDKTPFEGKKVAFKAHSDIPIGVYVAAAQHLQPVVKSYMWGEAGSPIMLYKSAK
ncbi:uncharacterized protein DUF2480 [Chitinophaga skermanii]|uniref:Uncharacterized protein DUF2480 n=1 Tax=Chitinophaga skermanii TaxID=331697 RepID=A0A327QF61_9BACT|nr:DUF2480 family protein [Chitinophaga skermanii]RAJ02414.1 uncharacterized protein DUF2480 [Chitinophaga skermanii]